MTDSVTILKCRQSNTSATKTFEMNKQGAVNKISFSAGMFFEHEEKPISNLEELYDVLKELSTEHKKFIIRGKSKSTRKKTVRRRIHGEHAAFDSCPRHWVMLDIDKVPIPDHLNPAIDPKPALDWVLNLLPDIFQDRSYIYKFSSSQNVPKKSDGTGIKTVSVHLVFWCDRKIDEKEWKRFFRSNPCPVDQALFSPVQVHYTASPIFQNMDDPLPNRIGFIKGKHEHVFVPITPEPKPKKSKNRPVTPPDVSQENIEKAIELILPFYDDGGRNRLCGAIAGTLYRGGWIPEAVADFIYQLATADNDEQALERQSNALRICDSIDNNEAIQGIPTLKDEFGIDCLDNILKLLGVGKPDIEKIISDLSNKSTPSEIEAVIRLIADLPKIDQTFLIHEIKGKTEKPKGDLKKILSHIISENNDTAGKDIPMAILQGFLLNYEGGRTLIRIKDGRFWEYNGRMWEDVQQEYLIKTMLPTIQYYAKKDDNKHSVSSIINALKTILPSRLHREDSPFQRNFESNSVINCQNGEVWYDEDGNTSFKPHAPESYLRHCLDVAYDPKAGCPRFKKTILDIFENSDQPEEMYRHLMEIIGYICQEWRDLAVIILFYGSGSNGKTSIVGIIERLLSRDAVMSDRINGIEDNIFKIGALDGKLLLIDDDVEAGACLPDGFLKKISERKLITGQHKNRPSFEFICRTVPLLLTNSYPSTKDISYGIGRRIMITPFNRRFTKKEIIPGLFNKIWQEEASGILNEVIAGFQRLKKRNSFDEPTDCIKAKNKWHARSNILTTFIEESCSKGDKQYQNISDFYDNFREFCEDNGQKRNIITKQGIKNRLESLGYDITTLDGYKVVRGLKSFGWGNANERGQEEAEKILEGLDK